MKKILTVFVLLFLTQLSFGQTQQVAQVNSLTTFNNDVKNNKVYNFVLSEATTSEAVADASKYYKEYFTVDFDKANNAISVKMINDDGYSQKIMRRLFSALRTNQVKVEGKDIPVDEFFREYIYTKDGTIKQ